MFESIPASAECQDLLGRPPRDAAASAEGSSVSLRAELQELYEEHAGALVRHATSFASDPEAARDSVQDAFIRYFELRRAGATIRHPNAWLVRVTRNQLIDRARRERRQDHATAGVEKDSLACSFGSSSDPAEIALLWEQIASLVSPREIECLRLRATGLSYAEIAKALGVEPGSVSVLLTRSREKVAPLLKRHRSG